MDIALLFDLTVDSPKLSFSEGNNAISLAADDVLLKEIKVMIIFTYQYFK